MSIYLGSTKVNVRGPANLTTKNVHAKKGTQVIVGDTDTGSIFSNVVSPASRTQGNQNTTVSTISPSINLTDNNKYRLLGTIQTTTSGTDIIIEQYNIDVDIIWNNTYQDILVNDSTKYISRVEARKYSSTALQFQVTWGKNDSIGVKINLSCSLRNYDGLSAVIVNSNLIDKVVNSNSDGTYVISDNDTGSVASCTVSPRARTAGSITPMNSVKFNPSYTFTAGETYNFAGRIQVTDSNGDVLETHYATTPFVYSSSITQTIVIDDSDYISNVMIKQTGNSSYDFYIWTRFIQTGTFGIKAYFQLYTLNNNADGLNMVIVNPPKYSDTLIKNFISRNANFKSFEFPDGITNIGGYAFTNCSYLALTSLPNTITFIGAYAFSGCTRLALASLPNQITNIPQYCFEYCTNINLMSLPSSLTTIGDHSFANSGLTSVTLPSTVTTLNTYAFYHCDSLTSVSMSAATNLTKINAYALSSCSALTTVTFPPNVTTIESSAFYCCSNLSITTLPNTVTSIRSSAFNSCCSITSISCNGVITTFEANAFGGSSSYPMALQSASFPNMTVNSFGQVFGSSTAANACQQLAFVDLGSIQNIANSAFINCYALQTIVLRRTDAICALAATGAFSYTPVNGYNSLTATIYVPSALISTYQNATNWKTFYNNGTVTFSAIEGSQYEIT